MENIDIKSDKSEEFLNILTDINASIIRSSSGTIRLQFRYAEKFIITTDFRVYELFPRSKEDLKQFILSCLKQITEKDLRFFQMIKLILTSDSAKDINENVN